MKEEGEKMGWFGMGGTQCLAEGKERKGKERGNHFAKWRDYTQKYTQSSLEHLILFISNISVVSRGA